MRDGDCPSTRGGLKTNKRMRSQCSRSGEYTVVRRQCGGEDVGVGNEKQTRPPQRHSAALWVDPLRELWSGLIQAGLTAGVTWCWGGLPQHGALFGVRGE